MEQTSIAPMMEHAPELSDDQIDAVISGERTGDPRADELAVDLGLLRRALNAPPSGRSQWTHLAAMRKAAQKNVATRRKRRRRFMVGVAATVGAVGSVSAMGGMAAAGMLPAPAQHTVEAVADTIGLDLHAAHPGRDGGGFLGTAPGQSGVTPGQSGTTQSQGNHDG